MKNLDKPEFPMDTGDPPAYSRTVSPYEAHVTLEIELVDGRSDSTFAIRPDRSNRRARKKFFLALCLACYDTLGTQSA